MCKSQHAVDERCKRKKITKSMKEIRAHLNL
jgi:Mg2+ and Co2+ transporter CorA